MKSSIVLIIAALTLVLAGCETSPMAVEYRVAPTVDPAVKQAQDAAALKRMRDRAQGNAADAL